MKRTLLVLIVLVIFSTVVIFGLLFYLKTLQNPQNPAQNNNSNQNANQPLGFHNQTITPKDTYLTMKLSFETLEAQYIANSDASFYQRLQNISSLAQKSYPKEYKDDDFILPCVHDGCNGKTNPDIDAIVSQLSSLNDKSIDKSTLKSTVNSLKASSYYPSGSMQKLNLYDASFSGLQSIYTLTKDDTTKKIVKNNGISLANIIKTEYPKNYDVIKKQYPFWSE